MNIRVEVHVPCPFVGNIHAVHSHMYNYECLQILSLSIQQPSVDTQQERKIANPLESTVCVHTVNEVTEYLSKNYYCVYILSHSKVVLCI